MRKSIAIFGGSLFEEMRYENNKFNVINNTMLIDLKKQYDVDNYSFKGLNSDRVLRILENIETSKIYDSVFIALGENEKNDRLFEYNLSKIIKKLLSINVRPVLVGLPNNYDDFLKLDDVTRKGNQGNPHQGGQCL